MKIIIDFNTFIRSFIFNKHLWNTIYNGALSGKYQE